VTEDPIDRLVRANDLDGLIRLIDQYCDAHDWDGLVRLRAAARFALDTGRQLWPAASHAEYRLALMAPPPWAASVIDDTSGRFALGPLTEVIAQSHTWDELAPHLDEGPARSFVAYERGVRGELIGADDAMPVLDIPFVPSTWEPPYPVAVYEPNRAQFDPPPMDGELEAVTLPDASGITVLDDGEATQMWRQLVEPWTAASNGRVVCSAVEGDHLDAIGAVGAGRARVAPLSSAEAMAWLAWAGASGGAHGRRRGVATGRFGAWWAAAVLGGVVDEWPVQPDDMADVVDSLQWFWWDAFEPAVGWQLHLAVADPDDGLAWAVSANDAT
jgi:hypothetical protein